MENLISIIVPFYNTEKYLNECIESIVNQTYKNIEIILVDDGSTDKSPSISDTWAQKDSRIVVIHQNNTGVATARKNGILKSRGKYLYFVDGDDYIDLNLCATVLETMNKNNADIVIFDANKVSENGFFITNTEKLIERMITPEFALEELAKYNINNFFWNKLYRREMLADIDFLEGRLWEDMGTMYKIFLNAEKIYCLPKAFYNYRMREGSIVNSINEKGLQDIFYILNKRYNDLINIYPEVAELSFSRLAISAIRLYDIALWGDIENDYLEEAIFLLEDNKAKILKLNEKKRFVWFYRNRKLYNWFRILKHRIGNIVKKIKR